MGVEVSSELEKAILEAVDSGITVTFSKTLEFAVSIELNDGKQKGVVAIDDEMREFALCGFGDVAAREIRRLVKQFNK